MRRPQGYALAVDPGQQKPVLECDTFTCCHCNSIVLVKPKAPPEELGGFCTLCMKNVCPKCVGKKCIPFEKRLLANEARGRLLRAVGI